MTRRVLLQQWIPRYLSLAATLLCFARCDTVLEKDNTDTSTQLDGGKDKGIEHETISSDTRPEVLMLDVEQEEGTATLDPAPDGQVTNPCSVCTNAKQVCIEHLDGICTSMGITCKTVSAGCGTCTAQCDKELCGTSDMGYPKFTCQAAPCPNELPGAVHCYGI